MSSEKLEQPVDHGKVLHALPNDSKATSILTTDENLNKPNIATDPWTQHYIEAIAAGICWI